MLHISDNKTFTNVLPKYIILHPLNEKTQEFITRTLPRFTEIHRTPSLTNKYGKPQKVIDQLRF